MATTRGAVLDFLASRFGGRLASQDATVEVALLQTPVVGGDADRVSLTMVNLSAGVIYVAPHPEVAADRGLRLAPTGGTVSVNVEEDALLPAMGWWAVGAVGAQDLYVLEVRREHVFETPELAP